MAQNPFIVQRPIKYGEPFCDRTPEIQRLEKAANRSEAVCILSIRRFGKTSLVNQVIGRLEEAGWLSIRLDLSRCFSLRSMTREFERALFSLEGNWRRLLEGLKTVSRIRPQLGIDPLTSQPSIGFDFSRPADDAERLKYILERIVGLSERSEGKIHLCMVLDEFQNIRKIDPKKDLEWLFRSVFQERGPFFVPFLLGSERHLLDMMIREESSAFFKSVTPMTLEVLPEMEVVSFVKGHFFSGLGLEIPEVRIRGIYRIFGGHPFAINWYWAEMWDLVERSGKMEPVDTWVDVAVRIILNQRDYYEAMNSRLPLGARKVLFAIAANEPVKRVFSRKFMVETLGMAQGSLQSAIKVLLEEDKIRKTPQGLVINDPLERLSIAVSELDEEAIASFVRERIDVAA